MSTWPKGYKHAMSQNEHVLWNETNCPGTRQLCCKCGQPTERCEEDEIYTDDGVGPLCVECWHDTDEYKQEVNAT